MSVMGIHQVIATVPAALGTYLNGINASRAL
jgi:hypothetical protein